MGDEDRIFHGEALLRRMVRYGLLLDSERKLDFVLGLTSSKLMERRLQTKVFKQGLRSRSTTRASSSASATSALGARSATSPPSWSARIRRSTSTSRSRAPSRRTAAPAASPGSTPRLVSRVATTTKTELSAGRAGGSK